MLKHHVKKSFRLALANEIAAEISTLNAKVN